MCIYYTYSHVTYIYLYANIICFQDIGAFTMALVPIPAQPRLHLASEAQHFKENQFMEILMIPHGIMGNSCCDFTRNIGSQPRFRAIISMGNIRL